jgi:hypothetical protein
VDKSPKDLVLRSWPAANLREGQLRLISEQRQAVGPFILMGLAVPVTTWKGLKGDPQMRPRYKGLTSEYKLSKHVG